MKNKVQLIAYVDRFGDGNFRSFTEILRKGFAGVYEGVHLLPFFTPFDGADAGFDPVDHTAVDSRLGKWEDVSDLSTTHDVMVDTIVNHMSWKSAQFQDVLEKGSGSAFSGMFLTMSSIFPDGASEEELAQIYRPRPGLPFTHYKMAGRTRLVWTTFTPEQVDIDTESKQGWEYLMQIIETLSASGVSSIRLDAVGYGAKQRGTTSFMIPKTFALITKIKDAAARLGLETLIEVHSYYKRQIEIASKVDRVYDFALPPLLLHSLFSGDVEALRHWISVRPQNAVNVLDTHDGIGVIDIGADSNDASARGLVTDEELDGLVEEIHKRTHGESLAATGASASNLDLYQINSTYYSALGCDDQKYLAARAVQFFVPGVPQVYYVGALAGRNDLTLLNETNVGRDINRHRYSTEEIWQELKRPVVSSLNALCRFRNSMEAFNGDFTCAANNGSLVLRWTGETTFAQLTFNPSVGVDSVAESVVELEWSDVSGSHRSVDLLNDPPCVTE